ncbi:MAG: N-acetylmuramoyl-L-alanine amidase, partial [Solirubrobacteraceae bacterium]
GRSFLAGVLVLAGAAGCGGTKPPAAPTAAPSRPHVRLTADRSAMGGRSRVARARTQTQIPAPHIVSDPIPFGATRKAQMTAYVRRHYGSFMRPTWRLIHPHVIVIHYTEASYSSTFNTFADDVPDSELHELPQTSAHFVIDTDGTIHQLVSLQTMARHTVGLNWTAIGIEHVGYSDAQVLSDRRQMISSLALVHWLRCRYGIAVRNVIGHNESLSSPYHHEDLASLRTQTHSDFNRRDMGVYRARLRRFGGCQNARS